MLFHVVRINRDPKDTYAARSLAEALDLANADPEDTIEVQEVEAPDAGAARLTTSPLWATLADYAASQPIVPFGWDAAGAAKRFLARDWNAVEDPYNLEV